jgi:hypothetical protein
MMKDTLEDIKVSDWLMIVSTMKGSSFVLQQVGTTTELVKTASYTFWRNGRSFKMRQKTVLARPATAAEVEQWSTDRRKQEPLGSQARTEQTKPSEEVVLARYLASVSTEEWARLGVAQLRKIRAAFGESK